MESFHSESIERLFEAMRNLKSDEDYYAFLTDLCTIKELEDMAQRLDTAVLLNEGKSYQEIQKQVKVSSATISRVNRCLRYGTGGYREAIKKLQKNEKIKTTMNKDKKEKEK